MQNSHDSGLARVRMKERNNRLSERAKGMATKTPTKRGAMSGFASNPKRGGRIAVKRRA